MRLTQYTNAYLFHVSGGSKEILAPHDLTFSWLSIAYRIEKTPRLFVNRRQRIGSFNDLTIAEENKFRIFLKNESEMVENHDIHSLFSWPPNGLLRALSIRAHPPTLAIVMFPYLQFLAVFNSYNNSYNKSCTLLQKRKGAQTLVLTDSCFVPYILVLPVNCEADI